MYYSQPDARLAATRPVRAHGTSQSAAQSSDLVAVHGLEVDAEVALLGEHLAADVAGGVSQVHLLVVVEGRGWRELTVAHPALVLVRRAWQT